MVFKIFTMDGSVKRWLLILFLLACAVRLGWVTIRYAPEDRWQSLEYPDEQAYWSAARSLAAGEGLVDEFGFRATYMPAYPAFLAVFTWFAQPLFWARIGQAIAGAWIAPATYLLARRWALLMITKRCRHSDKPAGRPGIVGGASDDVASHAISPNPNVAWPIEHVIAILAGAAAAVDPFLIFFSGLLLTETLFAAALVTAWMFVLPTVDRRKAIHLGPVVAAGLFLTLCVMLRPSAIVLVLAGPLAILVSRRCDSASIMMGVGISAFVFVGLSPWAVRNHATIGQWQFLTTRGGISLYDGLREDADGASDLAHTKTLPDVTGLNEIEWDRYFRAKAWAAVRRDPVRVLSLGWKKLLRTWSLRPNVAHYRQGVIAQVAAFWMMLLVVLALLGWWFARRAIAAWFMLLLPVACITLLHMVFVGSVRYRVPLMPMIMVFSAAGVVGLWKRMGSGRHGGHG